MKDTETKSRGINMRLSEQSNEEIKRFKKIANYIKGYNERKPFYTNKMIELFAQLSDEQIIELLKNK
jgi:hypothetical protein